jgi:hypothetical protein
LTGGLRLRPVLLKHSVAAKLFLQKVIKVVCMPSHCHEGVRYFLSLKRLGHEIGRAEDLILRPEEANVG